MELASASGSCFRFRVGLKSGISESCNKSGGECGSFGGDGVSDRDFESASSTALIVSPVRSRLGDFSSEADAVEIARSSVCKADARSVFGLGAEAERLGGDITPLAIGAA